MGNIFARRQVRCFCGKFSTTEIVIDGPREEIESLESLFGYSASAQGPRHLEKISGGYKGWSFAPFIGMGPRSYPCDNCSKDIIKNLKNNKIIFVTKKSKDGFWISDLP